MSEVNRLLEVIEAENGGAEVKIRAKSLDEVILSVMYVLDSVYADGENGVTKEYLIDALEYNLIELPKIIEEIEQRDLNIDDEEDSKVITEMSEKAFKKIAGKRKDVVQAELVGEVSKVLN